jgi:exodeoxyribonuclease V alpha subunit
MNDMAYKGTYDRTVYHDPVSGYCVINVKTADTSVPANARSAYRYRDRLIRFTATGYRLPLTGAVEISFDGEWTESKHGVQLAVSSWEEIIPPTPEGVRGYLASGLISGIGEKTAADIVERYGVKALDILEQCPERLLEVRGITETKLEKIKESYVQSRAIRDLMTWLAPFKITPNTAMKIQQEFGAHSVSIIRKNPYELCRISGFGFIKVDGIARKTGCPPNDPTRIRGALFYALDESRSGGHLYLETEELCKEALCLLNEKLPVPQTRLQADEVSDELYNVILGGGLVADSGVIYLPRCFEAEDFVARRVAEKLTERGFGGGITKELARVKAESGITLSQKQEDAVSMAFRHNLSIITGSPGTGKTTVLKAVIKLFQRLRNNNILLTAPTGRASRRMAESTAYQNAKTLHSALGLITGNEENSRLNKTDAIDADLVIIDEFSMVDMRLASELFARLTPGTKVLMVGDPDQLPSVGAGNVFREFISCGRIPVTVLDEIFRQSKDSLIAHNAKNINENKTRLYYGGDFVFSECDTPTQASLRIQQIYLEAVAKEGVENVQILSPYREDGDASAEKLNAVIRELVNPASPETPEMKAGHKVFRVNDRVMQVKNKNGVSNGDVGFVRAIGQKEDAGPVMTVAFSDSRFAEYTPADFGIIELAYAITIHKSMGSEYETVIIPVLSAHMVLLYRNLI